VTLISRCFEKLAILALYNSITYELKYRKLNFFMPRLFVDRVGPMSTGVFSTHKYTQQFASIGEFNSLHCCKIVYLQDDGGNSVYRMTSLSPHEYNNATKGLTRSA